MIALAVLGSVFMICLTFMYTKEMDFEKEEKRKTWADNSKLSKSLEKKLAEMESIKQNMESLLLKNGLGRK